MKGRILLVTFTFLPQRNGTCHLGLQYARGLRDRGYEVEIVTAPDPRRTTDDCDGFRVTEFDVTGNNRLGNPVRGQVEAYQAYLLAYDGDAILFNGWHSWPSEVALTIADRIPAFTLLLSQGTSYNLRTEPGLSGWLRWLSYRPYAWRFAAKLRRFDYYIVATEMANRIRFDDKRLADRLGIPNLRVIPNGANPLFFKEPKVPGAFRQKYAIPPGDLVLCVSNYLPSKGQLAMLRAFLAANLPNAVLVMIGSEFNAYSDQLISEAGTAVGSQVVLLANLPQVDIRHAYRDADLFVTATYMDAQPLMLLDAMAAGTAFLSRRVGCIEEFPGGLTFTSQDELQSKLIALMTDAAQRNELVRAGLEAAKNYYNWESSMDKYDQLLQNLIQSRQKKHSVTPTKA